jgi:hypothetical protein
MNGLKILRIKLRWDSKNPTNQTIFFTYLMKDISSLTGAHLSLGDNILNGSDNFIYIFFISFNFVKLSFSASASARKQLFCKLWSCVGLCGLQMCCFMCRHFSFIYSDFKLQIVRCFVFFTLAANDRD